MSSRIWVRPAAGVIAFGDVFDEARGLEVVEPALHALSMRARTEPARTSPAELELFAQSLVATDRVVLEATGNAWAIARILERYVGEVLLAHAKHVRAIRHAKIKSD